MLIQLFTQVFAAGRSIKTKNPAEIDKDKPAAILEYTKTQVGNIIHSPIALMLKSALVMSDAQYADMLPIAWELLMQSDSHTVSCAGKCKRKQIVFKALSCSFDVHSRVGEASAVGSGDNALGDATT